MTLAIFDLDNTLLAGDSDFLWGEFLVSRNLVGSEYYKRKNQQFYEDYKDGCLDIMAFLHFSLQPLTQYSYDDMHALHDEFMQDIIEPLILPSAEALVEQHRQQGDTLMIITATNSFVTAPIAQRLGITHLIATDPEFIDGKYTGKVAGVPSFQEGKVIRLNQWLADNKANLAGSYFYSDSHNDLPLLKRVTHAIAVDADDKLLLHAKQQGWKTISLRG